MSERWSLVSGPNNNNVNIKHSTPTLQMASRIILFTAPGKLVKTVPGNPLPADKETEAQGRGWTSLASLLLSPALSTWCSRWKQRRG